MLCLLLGCCLNGGTGTVEAGERQQKSVSMCDVHKGPCTQTIGEYEIKLDISPKPVRAMHELLFKVALSGKKPSVSPTIDLGMPGMNMGPNRVMLQAVGDGVYEGKGIIVKCPSGRRTRWARVNIDDLGTAEFIFDVRY